MILLFDIGNTSIGMGVCINNEITDNYRLNTDNTKTYDEYYLAIKQLVDVSKVTDIAIASVVPRVTELIKKVATKFFKIVPFIVAPGVKTGIKIKADNPKEVGADLICDIAGLDEIEKPTLIVDLGTANKYIYIKDGTFFGLIITPGVGISIKALVGNTALLPDVDVEIPTHLLGTNTVDCMKSGITYGIACQIDGIIDRISKEKNEVLDLYVTGGLSSIIGPLCQCPLKIDSKLVLKGLLKIYNRNRGD